MCELFANVRTSSYLEGKLVMWEELGVGLKLTDGTTAPVDYDWDNAQKMEEFLQHQERWNCYLRAFAAVGTDNAVVVPKYDITLQGTLCGGISHVLNSWHFHNRSLPADLALVTLRTSLGPDRPSLGQWRADRVDVAAGSSGSRRQLDLARSSNFNMSACYDFPSRTCPEGAPLANPIVVQPGRTAKFTN